MRPLIPALVAIVAAACTSSVETVTTDAAPPVADGGREAVAPVQPDADVPDAAPEAAPAFDGGTPDPNCDGDALRAACVDAGLPSAYGMSPSCEDGARAPWRRTAVGVMFRPGGLDSRCVDWTTIKPPSHEVCCPE